MQTEEIKKELINHSRDAVRKTIMKFREHPCYFFAETDAHSYIYHCLYSTKYEITVGKNRVYLVHSEYPTNYRYNKKRLINPNYSPDNVTGNRGHYDLAILNPEFVEKCNSIDEINNKNISINKKRAQFSEPQILCAIEMKFITSNSHKWIDQIVMDNRKLTIGKSYGVSEAYNIVFCNTKFHYKKELDECIRNTNSDIICILVSSYEDQNEKPISNNDQFIRQIGI